MPGDRLFCDTNVLLAAIDKGRPLHKQAMHVLNVLANRSQLCISGQVVRECLAVSTRPIEANGLGQDVVQALANVKTIMGRATLLGETREVTDRLLDLVREARCTGKQLHDANIVATMLEHGLRTLLTENVVDYRRFESIEVIHLRDITVGAEDDAG